MHGSGMYMTHIKRNSRTPYVVKKHFKVFFSQNDENHGKDS